MDGDVASVHWIMDSCTARLLEPIISVALITTHHLFFSMQLLQETLNHTRKDQKVGLLRADSGFYTQGILNGLAFQSINYIIATLFYPNVKRAVDG